jgi:ABC-type uncharacterized transport system substrate-binding protein
MDGWGLLRTMIARSSSVLVLFVLSGCAILGPDTTELPTIPEPVIAPEPQVIVPPEPEPEPEPVVVTPPPPPPPEPPNIEPFVAVVLSDRTPAYVDVAQALEKHLENHEIYDLSDRSLLARDAFGAIAESGASAVVAIGLPAARAARRFSTVPVVIGQVFNIHDSELLSDDVKAVAVLPPIGLQMDAWHALDSSVRNVGAILGAGHEDLIAETDAALKQRGVKFHYAIAESDRETLYLFNRLVRDIDGFILFPDNRILSRNVLNEMMNYASRHRVQIAVYNEPLLEAGAMFRAGTVASDIAVQIAKVLDQAIKGNIGSVPPVTGLSEIEIQVNPAVLHRLGLEYSGPDSGNTLAGVQ